MPFLAAVPAALATLATASTATTAAVATASLTLAETSAVIGAAGAAAGAYGSYKSSQFQAAVAKNNSIISVNNANSALEAGNTAETASRERTTAAIGRAEAAQAANGVDVGFGSTAAVREGIANTGELDALTIRHNAALSAAGYSQQSAGFSTESSLDSRAGTNALVGGALNVGASFIGGASSVAGKYATFQQSGALAGG